MNKFFLTFIFCATLLITGCAYRQIEFNEAIHSPLFSNKSQLQLGANAKFGEDKFRFHFGYAIDSSTAIIASYQKNRVGDINCNECDYFNKFYYEIGMGQHSVNFLQFNFEYFFGISAGEMADREVITQTKWLPWGSKFVRTETRTIKYQKYFLQGTLHNTSKSIQTAVTARLSYFKFKEKLFTDYNFEYDLTTIKNIEANNPLVMDIVFNNGFIFGGQFLKFRIYLLTGIHFPIIKNELTNRYFWFGAGTTLMFQF